MGRQLHFPVSLSQGKLKRTKVVFYSEEEIFILLRISSEHITGALATLAANCVSKVSLHTSLALEALGVEQTLEALPRVRVTIALS